MTIRDLIDGGIEIQGAVTVQSWDDEREDNIIHFRTVNDPLVIFPEEVMDKEITYMYTTMAIKSIEEDAIDIAMLVIEINFIGEEK